MRRIFVFLLAVALMIGTAEAAVYTDAPGTPTQDRAVSVQASWRDEDKTEYGLEALPADQQTMDMTTEVFNFVFEEGNRPARWFPEDAQKVIEEMVGNPDGLAMTEFMRLHAAEAEPAADLDAVMELAIDYRPGQPTVVVLGCASESGEMDWTVVKSQVTEVGRIEFEIPQDVMESLQGKDVMFSLMTGSGNGGAPTIEEENENDHPSKTVRDTIQIGKTVRKLAGNEEEVLANDFDLQIASENDLIRRELALLSEYVKEQNQPSLSWLPAEDQNRVRYLLGEETDAMIVSDYVTLTAAGYLPTSGDAVGTISFVTPYQEGKQVISALGTPKADSENADGTQMEWTVQPAIVRDDGILDIVFDQLALIQMNEETGLLLIFSEPMAD